MIAMKSLFDTNILIDYLNGYEQAAEILRKYGNNPAISCITWMEVMVGAKKLDKDKENATRIFLDGFEILNVTSDVAERAVIIRHEKKIKLPDAIIWATAQKNGRLLITRNPKDFKDGDGVILPYDLSGSKIG
ncbi:type II toxin-antitoxin system VapC family toxin [Photorhabdus viridis]|uniref:type II toxin-antitoxin system VapC family toxin n=1 Tax=Photorhabdus viridis TaxID=3163327 RepID=UPI0033075061